jgi:hypothetical protein
MNGESYIANYEDQSALVEAAKAYVGACLGLQRKERGPVFETWTEEMQQSATATLGTQGIMLAEAHATAQLNLDMVVYGVGLAIGTQTAGLDENRMAQMIQHLIDGITIGRSEAHRAKAAFQTTGSKN